MGELLFLLEHLSEPDISRQKRAVTAVFPQWRCPSDW
jgi:hypothetical protein